MAFAKPLSSGFQKKTERYLLKIDMSTFFIFFPKIDLEWIKDA